jgi:hypothetical protein
MSRSPSAFRQTDVTKAIKAVHAAGYSAARIQIDQNGKIDIVTTNPTPAKAGEVATVIETADELRKLL